MIWLEDSGVQWLGQETAPEKSTTRSLTVLEKATVASVIISGIGVAVSLWQILNARKKT